MMVKPNKMPKMELTKDPNAGEIDIPKIEMQEPEIEIINTPMGTTTVEILPGKKVEVIGKDGVFVISQKLNDGRISLLGPEGLVLFVKPEEIRNIK